MTSKKNSTEEPTIASLAGETFAVMQHAMDLGIEWGFSKMKDAADAKALQKAPMPPAASKVVRFGQGVLRFIGQAGEAYYKSYSEMKKKH